MFCTNCGSKLIDGAKFCPYCGSEVKIRPSYEEEEKEINESHEEENERIPYGMNHDNQTDTNYQEQLFEENKITEENAPYLFKLKKMDRRAIIGFCLALINCLGCWTAFYGFPLFIVCGILGIVFGAKCLRSLERKGIAKAALIIGIITTVITFLGLLVSSYFYVVDEVNSINNPDAQELLKVLIFRLTK